MRLFMFNTTIKLATVCLCAGVVAGCTCPIQRRANAAPEPVDETPLIVDGAMQLREWDRSVAYYSNGDTYAYPTLFWYEPAWNQPEFNYYFIETPLFIGQTLAMPLVMWMPPPWTSVKYTGVTVNTTHTAMPVLPPSMAAAEPMAPAEPVPAPEQPQVPAEMSAPVMPATQPS
jgi:hypothetical protein